MKIIGEILRPEPQVLYLEPFFGCNFRCPFCIHGSGHRIEAVQLGPRLFDRLKPVIETVNHVHITGLGEPLLNPHLLDYLTYFREKGKSYYVNTNGSLIDAALVELMAASRSELSISLDTGDRETYERIRQPGSWDKVISRVKMVSQIRTSRRSSYPLLYLTFHINAMNLTSLRKVPTLAADLGVDAVKFSWTILPESHRAHSVFRHREEATEAIDRVCVQLGKAGIHVQNEAVFGKRVRGCWAFSPMAFVGANGAVAACCNRWTTVGGIDRNRFEDIWNGLPRRKIVLAIANGRPERECRDCPQIRGVDYDNNEQDFVKPADLEATILAEKTKSMEELTSVEGLAGGFHAGVAAFLRGEHQAAASIFSALDTKYPGFFEIKNNLAVAYFYLANFERCREVLHSSRRIPHNETIIESNLKLLDRCDAAGGSPLT